MAQFFNEPGSNVYIVATMGFRTRLQPDIVKPILMQFFVKHPRFSSLQVENKETGELNWIPIDVDLEKHVIVPDLDPNMDGADQFVEDYVSNLSKTKMVNSKPQWEVHLLNVKTSDAEAVAIYHIHHSIADGMSLLALVLAHSRQVSNPSASPTLPGAMNRKFSYRKLGDFVSILYVLWNTLVAVFMFVLTALFLKDTPTPLKGPPGVELKPRRFVRRTINLQDFKLVKNALDCTINDVVLGVTQAGLSRYLNRRYGELQNDAGVSLEEKKRKNYLPKNIRFRAAFFFNLRASTKINAVSGTIKEGTKTGKFGNKIGYVILPLNIGIRDDPLDYVRQAKAAIDRKKASLEPLLTYLFLKFFIKFFGVKAAGVFSSKIFRNTTLWFSNVPGPREEISFDGHQVTYSSCTCYGQPSALLIHVISYSDKISFVLSTDEDTIPDPHSLCDDLEESLKLIKAAAKLC
ncbi:wax ester synthase/diacylglycerol acyltransferase 11-like [Apium graveolens]|uniref:wax ester synthase/diacylglycerol acyltransferase 11-like n=1 Tax=Apium graveolens TaxID=4045 RepID=UPI003D797189